MSAAPPTRPARYRSELLTLLAIIVGWLIFAGVVTRGHRVVLYDTFRDMGWAHNILAGRIWADPLLADQPPWYAPGSPVLVAGLARLTGLGVADLYGYAALWANAWLPVLLYVVCRTVWDRLTALLALATVFAGSYTWLTHATAVIPSLQGVALNLATLACWHAAVCSTTPGMSNRTAWRWAAACGVLLAASAWYHPLCALITAGAIFVQTALDVAVPGAGTIDAARRPLGRWAVAVRMLVVAAIACVLAAPLIARLSQVHAPDSDALRFFAEESERPEYYAQYFTPLILPCAFVGLYQIARRRPTALWLVGYLVVSLVGQGVAFLAQRPGRHVPHLLVHEFIWHGQLALGVCAAVGLATLIRGGAAGMRRWGRGAVLVGVVVGPGLIGLRDARQYLVDLEPLLAQRQGVADWIRTHTALADVFVAPPELGYQVIGGLTGRKCIVGPKLHTNPGVDIDARQADVARLLTTDDEAEFSALAAHYGARYVLVDVAGPSLPPGWDARHTMWSVLELVYTEPDGGARIYALRPDAAGGAAR